MKTFGFSDTMWCAFSYDPTNHWDNCVNISRMNKLKQVLILRKVRVLRNLWHTSDGDFWDVEKKLGEELVSALKV